MTTDPFPDVAVCHLVECAEKEEYPQFELTAIYHPPWHGFAHFSPSYHFSTGLITGRIVCDVRDNGKMVLSVGCGLAHLERLLVKRLSVHKSQIVLADMFSAVFPKGFEHVVFDMFGSWPDLGERFDYVLFPRSVMLSRRFEADVLARSAGLEHLILSARNVLKPNGQVRMNEVDLPTEEVDATMERIASQHTGLRIDRSWSHLAVERAHDATTPSTFHKVY